METEKTDPNSDLKTDLKTDPKSDPKTEEVVKQNDNQSLSQKSTISEVTDQKCLEDFEKSLSEKSMSTAEIERKGGHPPGGPVKPIPKPKVTGKPPAKHLTTYQKVRKPLSIVLDQCDPIRHWYGRYAIAIGFLLCAVLVIILLFIAGYWD